MLFKQATALVCSGRALKKAPDPMQEETWVHPGWTHGFLTQLREECLPVICLLRRKPFVDRGPWALLRHISSGRYSGELCKSSYGAPRCTVMPFIKAIPQFRHLISYFHHWGLPASTMLCSNWGWTPLTSLSARPYHLNTLAEFEVLKI